RICQGAAHGQEAEAWRKPQGNGCNDEAEQQLQKDLARHARAQTDYLRFRRKVPGGMPDHPRLFVRRPGARAGLSIRRRNKPGLPAAGLAEPLRRRDQQSEIARRSLVRGTHPYANATAHSVRRCRREYSGDADPAAATPLWLTPPAAASRTKGSLELQLPPALPQCPQPQRVEPDEARCVAVV